MNRICFILLLIILGWSPLYSQHRSKNLIKSLESTSPDEYKKVLEELKVSQEPMNKNMTSDKTAIQNLDKSDSMKNIINSISNSSAIANGQSNSSQVPAARVLKYKADDKSVEYYQKLREKFAEEEKIRLEKEAKEFAEKAKKEEEAKQARHLNPEQAPQFDKYRNGATNPIEKKKTAEEDYNALFK